VCGWTKDQVKGAPNGEADGRRSEDEEAALYRHYTRTAAAIVSGIAAVAVLLVGGMVGGTLRARDHRRAEDVILPTLPGRHPPGRRDRRPTGR
jgi:hypothetical protein